MRYEPRSSSMQRRRDAEVETGALTTDAVATGVTGTAAGVDAAGAMGGNVGASAGAVAGDTDVTSADSGGAGVPTGAAGVDMAGVVAIAVVAASPVAAFRLGGLGGGKGLSVNSSVRIFSTTSCQ